MLCGKGAGKAIVGIDPAEPAGGTGMADKNMRILGIQQNIIQFGRVGGTMNDDAVCTLLGNQASYKVLRVCLLRYVCQHQGITGLGEFLSGTA